MGLISRVSSRTYRYTYSSTLQRKTTQNMFARGAGMAFRGVARRARPCGARIMPVSSYAALAPPTRQMSMPPVAVTVANSKLNISLAQLVDSSLTTMEGEGDESEPGINQAYYS